MGGHQARRQKTALLQIFRGPETALLLHGDDFTLDLNLMDNELALFSSRDDHMCDQSL